MKVLKIIILVVVIGTILFIGMLWLALRTKTQDISSFEPYKSLVGTTVTTKQSCYIAKNYEHFVQKNPYLLQLNNRFASEAGTAYEVPIGTELHIKEAKAFTGGTSGFTNHYILGSLFIDELNQEVEFEYDWMGQKPLDLMPNHNDHTVYPLAIWQEEPLPFKYDKDDKPTPYLWPATTTNDELATFLIPWSSKSKFNGGNPPQNSVTFQAGINENTSISGSEIALLQLAKIPAFSLSNDSIHAFNKDHQLNISSNFISLVIGYRQENEAPENVIVNYDLNGNYIDYLLISMEENIYNPYVEHPVTDTKKLKVMENSFLYYGKKEKEGQTAIFKIQDDGKIMETKMD